MCFLKKIAQKFPTDEETSILTDVHLRVSQDSGEILAFDDNDQEITRCVVEQWIDNKDEDFYDEIFTEDASRLFDFGQVQQEMRMLQGKGSQSGKINTKKFFEGILLKLED